MQSALLDHPDAGFAKIWQVGCDIERELNEANEMFRKLNIHALNLADRIKRLEDIISRAAYAFFRDGSDGKAANAMLTILEEVRNP
jgi:hypothetical protein